MLSSRASSQPVDQTQVSHIAGRFFTVWATREAQEYWSGYPIPSPGELPDPGVEQGSPALLAYCLLAELPGKDHSTYYIYWFTSLIFCYSYSSSFIVAIHPDVNSPYISEFKQKVQLLPKWLFMLIHRSWSLDGSTFLYFLSPSEYLQRKHLLFNTYCSVPILIPPLWLTWGSCLVNSWARSSALTSAWGLTEKLYRVN